MPYRLAELQRGVEQCRNVEHYLIALHGEPCHPSRRDERGRDRNPIAPERRHPAMNPDISEGAIECTPAQLGGTRHRRFHVRPSPGGPRRGQKALNILHHVIRVDPEGHLGVFHVSCMGHGVRKSRVSSAP
jgi:hypothetical protein